MLALKRQRDESVMIGEDIEVMVIDVRGNKATLGIRAPSNVKVDRREVYLAKKQEARALEALAQRNTFPSPPATGSISEAGL